MGNVRVEHIRNGEVIDVEEIDNSIVIAGLQDLCNDLITQQSTGSGFKTILFTYDDSGTTKTSSQAGTVSYTCGDASFTVTATFTASADVTVNTIDLQNSSSHSIAEQTSLNKSLNNGDSLKVEWTIQFSTS